MGGEAALSHEKLLCRLQTLAERAVRRYALPATVTPQLINLSENATYRVNDSATGSKWALRVHREGYHSRTAIASELQWQIALKASGAAITPTPIPGNDGELIQTVAHDGLPRPRNVVLFAWEEGRNPPRQTPPASKLWERSPPACTPTCVRGSGRPGLSATPGTSRRASGTTALGQVA